MTNTDAENKTPAQKAAATRAANKAAKAAVAAAPASVAADLPEVIDAATAVITGAADDPNVVLAVTSVTKNIPARVRNVIYTIGFYLGVAATIAGPVVAGLTGDAQVLGISLIGLANAFTNGLAKLNLSKTADDLAHDTAKAAG